MATILVVDDDVFFRRLYTEILKSEDYSVESASSGKEALERLSAGDISLVLTDLVMPGIDGLELLRRARELDPPPDVILATGHATVETAINALKSGARDYLIKPFDPEELKHQVHTCLEQRRVLDENLLLKSQIRLYQKGQHLASSLDINTLLPQAIGLFLQELGGGRGFAFIGEEMQNLQVIGAEGLTEEQIDSLARSAFPLPDDTAIHFLSRKGPEVSSLFPAGFDSIAVVPLHSQDTVKGGIILVPSQGETFPTPLPLESLHFLCEQTMLGFKNALRYKGARDLIYIDDLTGLHNYRYLMMVLDQEIRRAERYGLDFSLVFIDLDHFKDINDTYGHLAGSHALREVADVLRKNVREVDLLFRYGGDEFTALLVETDPKGASVVSERIRKAIEDHVFLAEAGTPSRLTATIGHASFPQHASDRKDIIDLADRAMYEGKKVRNTTRGAWESRSK